MPTAPPRMLPRVAGIRFLCVFERGGDGSRTMHTYKRASREIEHEESSRSHVASTIIHTEVVDLKASPNKRAAESDGCPAGHRHTKDGHVGDTVFQA